MAKTPYHNVSTRQTPQSQPIPGTIPNSAGGYAFGVDDWTRLGRFLILGSEGGSYYATERKLTTENADTLMRCIKEDGPRVVEMLTEISVAGRNPKQQPIMFALAACAGADPVTRAAALEALPKVCRTGTHLFLFASYVEQFRGWGRGLRTAVAKWYLEPHAAQDENDLVEMLPEAQADRGAKHVQWLTLQLAKYRQREGWSHRDMLRLSKPRPEQGSLLAGALGWAVGKTEGKNIDSFLQAVDEAQTADPKRLVDLIEMFRLPWEVVPSEKLADSVVWSALLPNMGIGALVRNLSRLTANGTLVPMSHNLDVVVAKLLNDQAIKGSRIHPLNVLTAAVTYGKGRGLKGSLSWQPIGKISDALDSTFHKAFSNVVPANKRTLIGLDVSGSMTMGNISGTFLTPRVGAAAMSLVTYRTEPNSHVVAFCDRLVPIDISPKMSVRDVVRVTDNLSFGRTDCAQPMLYAMEKGLDVDTFLILTDSETWAGGIHPVQALNEYRRKTGIPARLIVVGMVSNGFSIADPNDAGMLDVVGFDSAAPAIIADFSAGRI